MQSDPQQGGVATTATGHVTQDDVDRAAVSLLMRGERPTIERVRGVLGRGSPNSVTKLLDRFYESLGARLAQEEAPESITKLAREMWGRALGLASAGVEEKIASVQAAAAASIKVADDTAAAWMADAEDLTRRVAGLTDELAAATARAVVAQSERAEAVGRFSALQQQHAELANTIAQLQEAVRSTAEEARALQEGARQREDELRRAHMLDIDGERTLRREAEQRVVSLQARLDALQARHAEAAMVRAQQDAAASMAHAALQAECEAAERRASVLKGDLSAAQEALRAGELEREAMRQRLADAEARLGLLSGLEADLRGAVADHGRKRNAPRKTTGAARPGK